MKRPLNVDFDLHLRIMGESKESLHISSEEDGYDFMRVGHTREPELHHYEEWADQLQYIVDWLRAQDKEGTRIKKSAW